MISFFSRSSRILCLFVGFALLSAHEARAEFSFDFESGAVWNGSNDVRIPGDDGTRFSLTDDLNADDPSAYFRARATWHINEKHDLSVLAAPLRMDYSGQFVKPVEFAKEFFEAGVPTEAKYRFDSYRLTYRYNFVRKENLTFGLGLTAKVRDAEIEMRQRGVYASDDNLGVVPLINFRLAWEFAPAWSLIAEGDWLVASQGRAEDILAAIQWRASDALAFHVGYRILEGGSDSDDTYAFALFHYLAAGMTVRF